VKNSFSSRQFTPAAEAATDCEALTVRLKAAPFQKKETIPFKKKETISIEAEKKAT